MNELKLKIFWGIDGTRGLPKWWMGDDYLISASSLWNKKNSKFRVFKRRLSGMFFLDSGGFSFFHKSGDYPFTVDEYLEYVNTVRPHFFATLDYPCEPNVNRTYLKNNSDRIEATVDYGVYIWRKRDSINSKPIIVIQGYSLEEYQYCYDLYRRKGVNADYYAFGSMCRRWKEAEINYLIRKFRKMVGENTKIHIFGLKISSLTKEVVANIDSIDTMAWCYHRYKGGYGCTKENFVEYKEKLIKKLKLMENTRLQLSLFNPPYRLKQNFKPV